MAAREHVGAVAPFRLDCSAPEHAGGAALVRRAAPPERGKRAQGGWCSRGANACACAAGRRGHRAWCGVGAPRAGGPALERPLASAAGDTMSCTIGRRVVPRSSSSACARARVAVVSFGSAARSGCAGWTRRQHREALELLVFDLDETVDPPLALASLLELLLRLLERCGHGCGHLWPPVGRLWPPVGNCIIYITPQTTSWTRMH